ncbi:hypothetical protein C8F01DRAFT_1188367 [Mycena amicta]|nr:hypothetical protein C8F01DRAFT_1188367 [Mycena amicta]
MRREMQHPSSFVAYHILGAAEQAYAVGAVKTVWAEVLREWCRKKPNLIAGCRKPLQALASPQYLSGLRHTRYRVAVARDTLGGSQAISVLLNINGIAGLEWLARRCSYVGRTRFFLKKNFIESTLSYSIQRLERVVVEGGNGASNSRTRLRRTDEGLAFVGGRLLWTMSIDGEESQVTCGCGADSNEH